MRIPVRGVGKRLLLSVANVINGIGIAMLARVRFGCLKFQARYITVDAALLSISEGQ